MDQSPSINKIITHEACEENHETKVSESIDDNRNGI